MLSAGTPASILWLPMCPITLTCERANAAPVDLSTAFGVGSQDILGTETTKFAWQELGCISEAGASKSYRVVINVRLSTKSPSVRFEEHDDAERFLTVCAFEGGDLVEMQ
jgi:hypothetical protein